MLHKSGMVCFDINLREIMIQTDADIQHGLAHMMIGEAFITNTIESDRFPVQRVNQFFGVFRDSHRAALGEYTDRAAEIIGYDEHHELDMFGVHGKFAGRLSVRESGLAIIESELHHGMPAGLEEALKSSCAAAVSVLRG